MPDKALLEMIRKICEVIITMLGYSTVKERNPLIYCKIKDPLVVIRQEVEKELKNMTNKEKEDKE